MSNGTVKTPTGCRLTLAILCSSFTAKRRFSFGALCCAALLITSCLSILGTDGEWETPHWSDPVVEPLDQPLHSAPDENFRKQWLQLAPEPWRDRIAGVSLGHQRDNVLVGQTGERILLLGHQQRYTDPQERAIAFLGRLVALDAAQIQVLYLYPPTTDRLLISRYLEMDSALKPAANPLLFQPDIGQSVILFDDSLLARYAQAFYPDDDVTDYAGTSTIELAQHTQLMDDFVESWLVMVYQEAKTERQKRELHFLQGEAPLKRLYKHLQRLL